MKSWLTSSLVVLACTFAHGGLAGEVTGTASFRERIAVMPGTRFTAVLIDVSLADAPATELARLTVEDAGNPPYRFVLPYNDETIRDTNTYAVRATLEHDGKLVFTTDTVFPVITRDTGNTAELVMVKVPRAALK